MTAVPVSSRGRFWIGTGLIALTAVTFGLVTTFARLAYDDGLSPETLVFLRCFGFVTVIGSLLTLMRRRLRLPRQALPSTVWIAVLTLAMSVGYLSSVAFIPVSLAVVILYTFPLMVGLLSSLLGREPMTAVKIIALIAAFAGLTLAIGPTFSGLDLRGIGLVFIAALSTTIIFTFGGPVMQRYDPLVVNLYVNGWMLVAMVSYLALFGGFALPKTAVGLLAAGTATLCYLTGYAALFVGLRFAAPVQSALLMNAEPPVSILAATLLLGERLTPVQLAGVAIIIAALVGSTLAGARRRAARPD